MLLRASSRRALDEFKLGVITASGGNLLRRGAVTATLKKPAQHSIFSESTLQTHSMHFFMSYIQYKVVQMYW